MLATPTPIKSPFQLAEPTPFVGGEARTASERRGSFQGDSQYDEGLVYGQDQAAVRARNQPLTHELANAALKTIPAIGLGILENAGYIGELFSGDQDYTNGLVELAKKGREKIEGATPIYKENPNEVFDLSDTAWWVNHGQGLVESVGEFLVTGAGVGGGLAKGAQALNTALKTGALGAKIFGGAAQLATASSLAYTEGAMSGADVYKKTLEQTGDVNLAAESAAKTVRLNTLLNTALNITSLSPLFKSFGQLDDAVKSGIQRQTKESLVDYSKRLVGLAAQGVKGANTRLKLLGEMAQEGVEEQVNVFAEGEGKRHKKGQGLFESGWLDRFVDDAMTDEGKLSFMLGAVGGAAQTAGMEYLPMRSYTDENGVTKRVSAHTLEGIEKQKYQKETINNLKKDVDYLLTAQQNLNTAIQLGDKTQVEQARHDLFNITALRSMRTETVNELANELMQIATVDNTTVGENGQTEAMMKGLADNIDDNAYKTTAVKKASDLKALNKEYRDMLANYKNPKVASELFRKRLDVYSTQSTLDEVNTDVATREANLTQVIPNVSILDQAKLTAEVLAYDQAEKLFRSQGNTKEADTIKQESQIARALLADIKQTQGDLEVTEDVDNAAVPLISSYFNKLVVSRKLAERKKTYTDALADPEGVNKVLEKEEKALTAAADKAKADQIQAEKEAKSKADFEEAKKKVEKEKEEKAKAEKQKAEEQAIKELETSNNVEINDNITVNGIREVQLKNKGATKEQYDDAVAKLEALGIKVTTPFSNIITKQEEEVEETEEEDVIEVGDTVVHKDGIEGKVTLVSNDGSVVVTTTNGDFKWNKEDFVYIGNTEVEEIPTQEADNEILLFNQKFDEFKGTENYFHFLRSLDERYQQKGTEYDEWDVEATRQHFINVITAKYATIKENTQAQTTLGPDQLSGIPPVTTTYTPPTPKEKEETETQINTILTKEEINTPTYGQNNKIAYKAQEQDSTGKTVDPFVINEFYKILHDPDFNEGTDLVLRVATESPYYKPVSNTLEADTQALEKDLIDYQGSTQDIDTLKLIAWAERVFNTKFKGSMEKGEYISFFQDLSAKGYEASFLLNHPKEALKKLKEDPAYKAQIKEANSQQSVNTVPIGIYYKGKLIGYLPTLKGTDIQLSAARSYIVTNGEVKTTVTRKTSGSLNKGEKKLVVQNYAIVPEFVIGRGLSYQKHIDQPYQADAGILNTSPAEDGYVYTANVTTSGKVLFLPVDINRVAEDKVDSMLKVLDLYFKGAKGTNNLSDEEKALKLAIEKDYDWDITTFDGFRWYFDQFFHGTNLDIKTEEGKANVEKISRDFKHNNHYIQLSGKGIRFMKSANLSEGGILEEYSSKDLQDLAKTARLREHLSNSFARVDLTKINNDRAFRVPILKQGSNEYTRYEKPTYNEHVANVTSTNVVSVGIGNGKQAALVQPVIHISFDFMEKDSSKPLPNIEENGEKFVDLKPVLATEDAVLERTDDSGLELDIDEAEMTDEEIEEYNKKCKPT